MNSVWPYRLQVGIEIKYDKRKMVPVTVNFKFRSGVSVQATSGVVLKSDK